MAVGKTHDKINVALLMIILINGYILNLSWIILLAFSIGFLFSTFFFSPDIDLGPKKRSGILQPFIYPYSIFFKHRGVSHFWLLGTISRIFYGLLLFIFLIFLLSRLEVIEYSVLEFLSGLKVFVLAYDYRQPQYKILTWIFGGLFAADLSHIAVDRLSTVLKKILKFF